MNWLVRRIGAVALVAIGMAAFNAGSVGAVSPAGAVPPHVTVLFVVHGDLTSLEGRLHDFNCVERVQPNPFFAPAGAQLPVDVETFHDPFCADNEAIWLITTKPRSGQDAPETMGVRLRYGPRRPTQVAFLHTSKDLRWTSEILSPSRVVVIITGK